jgi:chitinase
LLKASDGRGVRMDLLLGDPSWILPEHRVELANLVRFFAPFEFDGLHLDLEPDSIPGAASRRRELAGELIRTLELIDGVTDLPISLSVHPRYLEGDLRSFFGPELAKLNPEEVAVMLYSTRA